MLLQSILAQLPTAPNAPRAGGPLRADGTDRAQLRHFHLTTRI